MPYISVLIEKIREIFILYRHQERKKRNSKRDNKKNIFEIR
jgi:hypothetical protein